MTHIDFMQSVTSQRILNVLQLTQGLSVLNINLQALLQISLDVVESCAWD